MSLEGIDVHDGQGGVDWHRVASVGKTFAFVRAAYGDRADKLYVQNFVGAKHQGMVCGLYHFYRATKDPNKQAKLMVDLLKDQKLGFGTGDLPPVIDVEDNPNYDGPWDPSNNAAYLEGIRNWCDTISREFDCTPIIYTRASFWTILGNPSGFESFPLWVSHYKNGNGSPKNPGIPEGWANYAFWQYSELDAAMAFRVAAT